MKKPGPKIITLIVVVVFVILSIVWVTISANKKPLIASGHPDWPPIMFQKDAEIIGAGPELVTLIFGDLGIKVESRYIGPWDVVQQKAKSGEVDVLVAAYKTVERQTYMDYSIPYTTDPIIVNVKKGKAFTFNKWDDLIGKKGVVMTGDSYGQTFDDYLAQKLTTTKVNDSKQAFNLLKTEKADYFIYALYSAKKEIKNQGLTDVIEILPKYVGEENFYITISKKSPYLKYLPEINRLINQYKTEGTINNLLEKY